MPPLNRWNQFKDPLGGTSSHSAISSSSYTDDEDQTRTSSKSSSNHRRHQKMVTFHQMIKHVEFIDHRRDWSIEDRSYRWHSQQDYVKFRQDIVATMFVVRNHPEKVDDVEYTARGIEGRGQANVERRQYIKHRAKAAVLDEQQFQRTNTKEISSSSSSASSGLDDVLASHYSHAAKPALQEALDFAVLDQIAAFDYQMEGRIVNAKDEFNDETKDEFNDDWISSISALSPTSVTSLSSSGAAIVPNTNNPYDAFGFSAFGEDSGFDDSWITQDM